MKENINEHDKTKQMMDIIRNGFKSKLITEAEEPQVVQQQLQPGDDPQEPNDSQKSNDSGDESDVINLTRGDTDFDYDLGQMKEQIDGTIEITNYKVYIVDRNVIMNCVLLQDIPFTMNYQDTALTIEYNDKTKPFIDVLQGYYENWKKSWGEKLYKNSEYRAPENNQ